MSRARGMTPKEIRAEMVLRGIKLGDIAKEAGVSQGYVHQVIYSVGRNKGYRIRPYIARAIGKTVDEVWPESAGNKDDRACKTACL